MCLMVRSHLSTLIPINSIDLQFRTFVCCYQDTGTIGESGRTPFFSPVLVGQRGSTQCCIPICTKMAFYLAQSMSRVESSSKHAFLAIKKIERTPFWDTRFKKASGGHTLWVKLLVWPCFSCVMLINEVRINFRLCCANPFLLSQTQWFSLSVRFVCFIAHWSRLCDVAIDHTQCFTVSTSEVAIIEKWGRYSRTAHAGCNFICCPVEQMVGKLSFRWVRAVW